MYVYRDIQSKDCLGLHMCVSVLRQMFLLSVPVLYSSFSSSWSYLRDWRYDLPQYVYLFKLINGLSPSLSVFSQDSLKKPSYDLFNLICPLRWVFPLGLLPSTLLDDQSLKLWYSSSVPNGRCMIFSSSSINILVPVYADHSPLHHISNASIRCLLDDFNSETYENMYIQYQSIPQPPFWWFWLWIYPFKSSLGSALLF